MPLRAGDLDRRIVLQRLGPVMRDAFNNPIESPWVVLARRWASKRDVSDRERLTSQEVGADITTRFQIRYDSQVADLNPKDRLVFDGRTYEISAVKEIGRREGLEISATAKAD